MAIQVNMSIEDSQAVEKLFIRFHAYCNVLGYLSQYGSLDTDLFDKKWEEAVIINQNLEALKNQMDKKYRPLEAINYTNYIFDFEKKQLVYEE